jgi:hypothetical protein
MTSERSPGGSGHLVVAVSGPRSRRTLAIAVTADRRELRVLAVHVYSPVSVGDGQRGRVTRKVLHHAPCPVLLAPRAPTNPSVRNT